jgi:hypothetical protein
MTDLNLPMPALTSSASIRLSFCLIPPSRLRRIGHSLMARSRRRSGGSGSTVEVEDACSDLLEQCASARSQGTRTPPRVGAEPPGSWPSESVADRRRARDGQSTTPCWPRRPRPRSPKGTKRAYARASASRPLARGRLPPREPRRGRSPGSAAVYPAPGGIAKESGCRSPPSQREAVPRRTPL